jgi:hypothetical protein
MRLNFTVWVYQSPTDGQVSKGFVNCKGIARYAVCTYAWWFKVVVRSQVVTSRAALYLEEVEDRFRLLDALDMSISSDSQTTPVLERFGNSTCIQPHQSL